MRFRSCHRLLRAAPIACALSSGGCAHPAVPQPAVPQVAAIPVAPIAVNPLPQPVSPPSPAPSANPETSPSSTAPATVGVTDEPAAAPEPEAETPPEKPSPHVVLVDEPPYRRSLAHAKAEPTHATARRHGHASRPYHPAPGVVVDVADAGGGKAAELERAARSAAYWPFRRCYEEGLRRDQKLAGKVSLDVDVSPSGSVEHASVATATVHDDTVALCVGREAAHLSLAPGPGSKVRMDVGLYAGDEPVVVPRAVPHADELREALRASWPAVEQCYASELATHPDAGGDMELRFRARSTGEVVEVAETGENRFSDVGVTRCVLGVYRTAKLPAARICTSRETSFAYTMHFEARR
ncbi:MAG TPA: AgmX/PglI C-terminal domain-containing protein [Polyangiaceae bacterium]